MEKFDDGSQEAFVELPVQAAWLKWSRGNAQLADKFKTDPGVYLGGWRAGVTDIDNNKLPELPLPVVERVSEDGQHKYSVYASNFVYFFPILSRTRFELRQKVTDKITGKEKEVVVAISKERVSGYQPNRQAFGLVFDRKADIYRPAVLKVATWSAFISFEKASQAWKKVAPVEGKMMLRRYGTQGVTIDGSITPHFEIYAQGRSTPIEAVGTEKPRYIDINPEFDALWNNSVAWAECPRWNAVGEIKIQEDATGKEVNNPDLIALDARAKELGLTNVDINDLVKQANGDYKKALSLIEADQSAPFEEQF